MSRFRSACPHALPGQNGKRERADSPIARLAATFLAGWLLLLWAALPATARQPLAAIVVDARSGKVLFAHEADSPRYPASITKVMTLYLLFRELRRGTLSLSTLLRVSRNAASRQPSKLWLKPGSTITVDQAIRALAVKSANDVAAVVAENLAGSEAAFAREMTRVARAIGMTRTTFRNASGLPRPANVTTARDLATLSLRMIRDFPDYYRRYFALKTFTWRGRVMRNHNRLLWRVRGMDGLKTGYTRAAGSNLAASVRRNGKRIVAVVLGARSSHARNIYMANLIERTFRNHRLARGSRIAAVAGTPPGWRNFGKRHIAAVPPSRLRPRVGRHARALQASPRPVPSPRPLPKKNRKALDKLIRNTLRQDTPAASANKTPPLPPRRPDRPAMAAAIVAVVPQPRPKVDRPRVHVRVLPPQARPRPVMPSTPLPTKKAAKDAAIRTASSGQPGKTGIAILPKPVPAARPAALKLAIAQAASRKMAARVHVSPAGAGQQPLTTVVIDRSSPIPEARPQAIARLAAAYHQATPEEKRTASSASANSGETAVSGWRIVSGEPRRALRLLRTSWNIQIGAFPSQKGAERRLAEARRLSRIVRRAIPVIIQVKQKKRVYFRARFTGFRQATAVRVCRQLKRRGLSCLPLPPQRKG